MPLSVGDKLGPYEILALVAKGGMGEVYRAHDYRLNRDVAIKFHRSRKLDRCRMSPSGQFTADVGQEPQTPALAPRPRPASTLRYTLCRTGTN